MVSTSIHKKNKGLSQSLKSLSEIRWNARKSAVKAIKERLCHVLRTLVVRDGKNDKVEAKAKGEELIFYICKLLLSFTPDMS